MRSSLRRVAAMIVVGLQVAACGSSPTPPPVTTAAPAPTASSPVANPPPSAPPPVVNAGMTAVAAGSTHTCALTGRGGVTCWGSNESGQLGNGSTTDSTVPVDVPSLASGISAIAAGGHTCALTVAGAVTCWGPNAGGQLGDGTTIDSGVPVNVQGLTSTVRAITVGRAHSCALTAVGGVTCWGSNTYGQLGNGTFADSSAPVPVLGLESGITAIAAGDLHTCALTDAGGVTCWGYGGSGGSGSGVPAGIPGLQSGIVAIAASYAESCALTTGGVVTCWNASIDNAAFDIAGLPSGINAISGGFGGTCALTTGGSVWCWGGYGAHLPTEVAGLAGGATAISAGGLHACALMESGGVECWGDNWDGQLGDGRPCSTWSRSAIPVAARFAAGTSPSAPSATPIGPIDHAAGPTDVVLRLDVLRDVAVSELEGEQFHPGPEFTLYGDGTVIFRNDSAEPPPAEGPIVRGRPFRIAHLRDDQVQALLRFALDEGGLRDACERYETRDTDTTYGKVLVIRAGGVDKRVEDIGSGPFGALYERLLKYDGGDDPALQDWVPARYWGNLFDAAPLITAGVLPDPAVTETVPWPWPDIAPVEFSGIAQYSDGRRVMSATEAAVLGLSDSGGVVQRVYLIGPDRSTLYYFSLWPMLPDEAAPPTASATLPVHGSAREIGERVLMAPGPGGNLFVSIPGPSGSVVLGCSTRPVGRARDGPSSFPAPPPVVSSCRPRMAQFASCARRRNSIRS